MTRRALVATLAVVALVVAGSLVVIVRAATEPEQRDETHQSWRRPVEQLTVDDQLDAVDAGPGVVAGPGAADRLDVDLALRWNGERPVLAEDWIGPSSEPGFYLGGNDRRSALGCAPRRFPAGVPRTCEARYTLGVPATAALGVHTRDAPIDVHDLAGATSVGSRSGPITLTRLAGSVTVQSGAGDVTGTGLTAQSVAVTADGRVDLRFARAPQEIVVRAGPGPVTIEVPRGGTYEIDDSVYPESRRHEEIPSTDAYADHHIMVVAGTGLERHDGGTPVTIRYTTP